MHVPVPAPPALVGRDRELAILRQHLDAAIAGRGGLVLIGGEAGVGKTALAEALCREATEQGAFVLVGRCYDLTETPAYGPWIDLFERYRPGDDLPSPPPAFAEPGIVGAVPSQAALFRQTEDFFAALCAQRPVVLLLEDLHWADPASLDLLRALARSLPALPFLLVATYRADELSPAHPLTRLLPAIVRESPVERLDLRPLRTQDLVTLVAERYRLTDADTTRLAAYAHQRSEGNPLFVGELLRTLEDEGIIQRTTAGWTLGFLANLRVPPLLRQIIDGRLARLGDERRRLLATAAVIGHEVPLNVWATIGEVDEDALLDVVERGVEARMLIESPDGARVQFAHALIRETLYEAILATRRRALHRRAGEALAALPRPDAHAVAHHFLQSGDARAAAWLIRAGENAQRAYAWQTAAARFEAAAARMADGGADAATRGLLLIRLGLLRRHTAPDEGIRALEQAALLAREADDPLVGALALCYSGHLRCYMGELGRGTAEMAAGVSGLDALSAGDAMRYREAVARGVTVSENDPRVTLTAWLAHQGRYRDAHARATRILADGQETARMGNLSIALGVVHSADGRPDEARRAWAHGRDLFRQAGHYFQVATTGAFDLIWTALPYYADAVAARRAVAAEADDAWDRSRDARAAGDLPPRFALMLVEGEWHAARALVPTSSIARGLNALRKRDIARLAYGQGDRDVAWEMVRQVLPAGPTTPPGETRHLLGLDVQRLAAALALDEADRATAEAWLKAHDRWLAWSGAVLGRSEGHALWARYHRQAGDTEQAHEHAARALAHATEPRQPLALIVARRLLGGLETDAGRFDDAREQLDRSLDLADACAAPFERALTLLALAELHAARGDRAAARDRLDAVRAICRPLDAGPTLARVDSFAHRLGATSTAAPAHPAGLSDREVEVLLLVSAGLTNPQVAARLFLSPRTVQQHLRSIYNKLGVSTRTAATRFAVEHHLG